MEEREQAEEIKGRRTIKSDGIDESILEKRIPIWYEVKISAIIAGFSQLFHQRDKVFQVKFNYANALRA